MIYVFHLKWNGLSEDDKKRFVSSLAENQEHSSKAFEWAHELGIQYGMYLNSTLEATSDWL
jgi:hypothetical protein